MGVQNLSAVCTEPRRRLAPEVKIFIFLLVAFSLYNVLGVIFSSYVGVQVSLLSLSLLLIFYWFLAMLFGGGAALLTRLSRVGVEFKPSYRLDFLLITLAIAGVVFIGIDRYFYRGIDVFGMSFAEIRASMNSEGGRRGVSSIFSVIGNLSQVMYLLVAPRLIFYWEEYVSYSFAKLRLIFAFLVACLFLSSYLLGGRTLLLLFVFACAGAALVRMFFRRSMIPKGIPKIWFFWAGAGALLMSLGVFWVRSQVFGGMESADYLERLLEHVHPYSLDFSGVGVRHGGLYGDFVNYFFCLLAYIFHQIWVFDAAVNMALREGSVLLLGVKALIPGLIDGAEISEVFQGLFFSGAAAFYYDLDILGLIVGPFILSALYAISLAVFVKVGHSWAVFFPSVAACSVLMAPVAHIIIMPYAVITFVVSFLVLFFILLFRALRFSVVSGGVWGAE